MHPVTLFITLTALAATLFAHPSHGILHTIQIGRDNQPTAIPNDISISVGDSVFFAFLGNQSHHITHGYHCHPHYPHPWFTFSGNTTIEFRFAGMYGYYDALGENCEEGLEGVIRVIGQSTTTVTEVDTETVTATATATGTATATTTSATQPTQGAGGEQSGVIVTPGNPTNLTTGNTNNTNTAWHDHTVIAATGGLALVSSILIAF